jgi:sugar lactone lactonase YvrE
MAFSMSTREWSFGPSTPALTAKPVCEIVSELGEGPRWDPDHQALAWLDVPRLLMHRIDLQDSVTTVSLSARVSAIAVCISGRRYVAATEFGFGFVDPMTGYVEPIANVEAEAYARMNDGGVDLAGRFFAGSVSVNPELANGSVHCLRPDGSVERLFGDVRLSNGIGWSADGRSMYFVDSLRRSLDRFDYETATGALHGRQSVVVFAAPDGVPDGLCLDAQDRIWVALWGGGAVRCYAPSGELLRIVRTPCKNVTACSFGGTDNDTLYISSAAIGDETSPAAGKLFACQVGARGATIARFDDHHWPLGRYGATRSIQRK